MPIANWDDLRLFLAVARAGRIAAAARLLHVDQSTVARRMDSLERQMSARLLDRSTAGIQLTAAGVELVRHAERMEAEAHSVERRLEGIDRAVAGAVRLATPEAFGAALVAPNIGLLHADHPALEIELVSEPRLVSLDGREADLAVMLAPPPRGRLVTRRLTDYRLGLFASQAYLERHGPIGDVADLPDHPFVAYIDDLIDVPELRYLDQVVDGARTRFRSSSLIAQQTAVAAGAGLGLLHGFAVAGDPRLVPVLPDAVVVTRSYWLVMHRDSMRLPRIRAVADFLDRLVTTNRTSLGA